MTDITTIGGLRATVRAGPESLPLTIWCDGVQVQSCIVQHGPVGVEMTLRTGKPTPTEAETLAEANSMGETLSTAPGLTPFAQALRGDSDVPAGYGYGYERYAGLATTGPVPDGEPINPAPENPLVAVLEGRLPE